MILIFDFNLNYYIYFRYSTGSLRLSNGLLLYLIHIHQDKFPIIFYVSQIDIPGFLLALLYSAIQNLLPRSLILLFLLPLSSYLIPPYGIIPKSISMDSLAKWQDKLIHTIIEVHSILLTLTSTQFLRLFHEYKLDPAILHNQPFLQEIPRPQEKHSCSYSFLLVGNSPKNRL